jgi:hypothetical protein
MPEGGTRIVSGVAESLDDAGQAAVISVSHAMGTSAIRRVMACAPPPSIWMALGTRRMGRYDTVVMNAGSESVVHLKDGRRLAYVACGAVEGTPVIALRGLPGSRLQ